MVNHRATTTRTGIIHLINPKTDSLTTRPLYLNGALYSPLAGLLAVAAGIPRDRYEVVLTDENIEPIDFDLKADLVGLSAMTSYVNRGYEIADAFRARGVPVVMGGVHPSFMPQEALKHCDAVVIGEAELVAAARRLHEGAVHVAVLLEQVVARLPPGLHLLRRAPDERPQVPLPAGRRGDPGDRELRLADDLDQRRRLLRHPGASEGGHAGAPGPRGDLAGRGHLEARAGRPDARARRRERVHAAQHRLRVDLALHPDQRPQAREPSGDLRRAGGDGTLLRHHGVRTVHVRLRPGRSVGVPRDGAVQHRGRLRRLRVFGPHPLSGHPDLVRAQEGQPHRVLRLGKVRSGQRRLPAGADDRRRAPT